MHYDDVDSVLGGIYSAIALGIRVPFIASCPKRIPGGRVCGDMNYFPDLMNTFCELSGLPQEGPSDGHSIVPFLKGEVHKQHKHEYLYFEFEGQIAVRKGDFKYYQTQKGKEFLYNIKEDVHEDNDIKSDHPELFAFLKTIITKEHNDYSALPIPEGEIP